MRNQRGLTLFMAMIILVMATLLVVSAFRVSNTNLKIVSAMQGRQEALASAQAAIEQVLSSKFFAENPWIVASTPIDVDINADGTPDFTVAMTLPKCLRTAPVGMSNPPTQRQIACAGSSRAERQGSGPASWCSDTIWELEATTIDRATAAQTTVRQGVALPTDIFTSKFAC